MTECVLTTHIVYTGGQWAQNEGSEHLGNWIEGEEALVGL